MSDNYTNYPPYNQPIRSSGPSPDSYSGGSTPNTGWSPAPVPAVQQNRRSPWMIFAAVLLIAAIVFGVVRYFGAQMVTQNFMNDVYSYKFSDALSLVCPDQQAQAQQELQAAGLLSLFRVNIDTSQLSYTIQSESLNTATVSVTGTISAYGIASSNVNQVVTLQANGLGWCINTNTNGSSS